MREKMLLLSLSADGKAALVMPPGFDGRHTGLHLGGRSALVEGVEATSSALHGDILRLVLAYHEASREEGFIPVEGKPFWALLGALDVQCDFKLKFDVCTGTGEGAFRRRAGACEQQHEDDVVN